MPFTIPNAAPGSTVEAQAQGSPDSGDFSILATADQQGGVIAGCAVTAHASALSLDIAAGQIIVPADAAPTVSAVSGLAISTADATNPRIDLVVVSDTGAVSIAAGTAASNPVYPSIPASSIVLAAVYVAANATVIASGDITDKRVLVPDMAITNTVQNLANEVLPANFCAVVLSEYVMNATNELIFGNPSEMWVA